MNVFLSVKAQKWELISASLAKTGEIPVLMYLFYRFLLNLREAA